MISLLSRLFIKNYKDYSDNVVREKYGVLCGGVGIFLNVILFFAKFIAGTLSASVAMVADAFNNLSDAASSIIQILGFKLSSKKPDIEHPFGHGRIEYISALVISFLVLIMGVELFKSSVNAIINPSVTEISLISFIIMLAAICVKVYMMCYNFSVAKKIKSVAMSATGMDSLFDAVSTSLVIISFIFAKFTTLPVDGIAGIVVSCFILYGGFSSAMETITPLLGVAPEPELVMQIEEELLSHEPIIGMHDLIVHDYGPGRQMISLHAEVPGDRNIFELHDVIDNAEVSIAKKLNCQVVIHMDPIDTKNENLKEMKEFLRSELSKIDADLNAHDVRMVPGPTHINLIFDVVKPVSLKMTDDELHCKVQDAMRQKYKNLNCVITFDQPYV